MKTDTFSHDGVVFQYDLCLEGEKQVVLQHGLTDYALCWGDLVDDLCRQDCNIAMMDARGHGRSGKPGTGYGLETMTGDLMAFIEHIKVEHPIAIGHSMGGSIVAHAIGKHPDRFRAAVLIDPVFTEHRILDWQEQIQGRKTAHRELQSKSHAEITAYTRKKHPLWNEKYVQTYVHSKLYASEKIFSIMQDIDKSWKEDLEKAVCPILLITAEKEKGAIISPETTLWIKQTYPNIQHLHVTGVGHSPHRENYPLVFERISEFIDKQYR